jgi:hypothetical protein
MKKTLIDIQQEIENKMIEHHNETFRYRIPMRNAAQIDFHKGQITIEYIKGTIVVDEYFTIEEVRDIKLQSIGI